MVKIKVNDFDTRLESDYDNIRDAYEMDLIDNWYASYLVSEVNDWRDEFCKSEYDIYLENLWCSQ